MSEASGPKVFVGNLDFKTTEPVLAKAFESCGKVKSANIIVRGRRSLGYGFVEFENGNDADNAVKDMNKKEIDGRPVNVELAKPKKESPKEDYSPNQRRGNPQRSYRGASYGSYYNSYSRPRRRPNYSYNNSYPSRNNYGYRRTYSDRGQYSDRGSYSDRGQYSDRGSYSDRGQYSDRGSYSDRGQYSDRGPVNEKQGRRPSGPMRPRNNERPQRDTRAPSTTTLFVANLPFSVSDEDMTKIFAEFNPLSAHVVKTRSGRSRGYGFVEFENEDLQLKAKQGKDNSEVKGSSGKPRQISVKVALQENENGNSDDDEKSNGKEEKQ